MSFDERVMPRRGVRQKEGEIAARLRGFTSLSAGVVSQPYQTPITHGLLLTAVRRPQAELLNRLRDYHPLVAGPLTPEPVLQ